MSKKTTSLFFIFLLLGFIFTSCGKEDSYQELLKANVSNTDIIQLINEFESCRDYAKAASDYLIKSYTVDSAVLNFKRPDYEYIFTPDIIKLSNNASSVSSVASTLRYMLFGPVVDKWVQDGMEMDIRIAGKDLSQSNYDQLLNLHIYIFSKDSFSKSLAFFMLFGILNSIITSTLFFPGLLESRKKKNHPSSPNLDTL